MVITQSNVDDRSVIAASSLRKLAACALLQASTPDRRSQLLG